MNRPLGAVAFVLVLATPSCARGETLSVPSFDGLELTTVVDAPKDAAANKARRVVILLHGSGPIDHNGDLSKLSAPGTTNYFFADIAQALTAKGFTVIRYNKRAFEMRERARKDPQITQDPKFQAYGRNPLLAILNDARHFVAWSAARYPEAGIYLLGHSEGAYLALQVSHGSSTVKGVGLIGFYASPLDAMLLEEYVYRPMWVFDLLDANKDGCLSAAELSGEGKWQKRIARQAKRMDLNGDGCIDRTEFMAGNYANLLLDDAPALVVYRLQEAALARPGLILRSATIDVSFFQGEWDNESPAYHARSVELMNKTQWFKPNLHFRFFPKRGHALDPRDDQNDLLFRKADPAALRQLAADLDERWK